MPDSEYGAGAGSLLLTLLPSAFPSLSLAFPVLVLSSPTPRLLTGPSSVTLSRLVAV